MTRGPSNFLQCCRLRTEAAALNGMMNLVFAISGQILCFEAIFNVISPSMFRNLLACMLFFVTNAKLTVGMFVAGRRRRIGRRYLEAANDTDLIALLTLNVINDQLRFKTRDSKGFLKQ